VEKELFTPSPLKGEGWGEGDSITPFVLLGNTHATSGLDAEGFIPDPVSGRLLFLYFLYERRDLNPRPLELELYPTFAFTRSGHEGLGRGHHE